MFTGHQWEGESGLYYAPERYYSPFQASPDAMRRAARRAGFT